MVMENGSPKTDFVFLSIDFSFFFVPFELHNHSAVPSAIIRPVSLGFLLLGHVRIGGKGLRTAITHWVVSYAHSKTKSYLQENLASYCRARHNTVSPIHYLWNYP
jgi:hypothetical protein